MAGSFALCPTARLATAAVAAGGAGARAAGVCSSRQPDRQIGARLSRAVPSFLIGRRERQQDRPFPQTGAGLLSESRALSRKLEAASSSSGTAQGEGEEADDGPVSLGTAQLPPDVNLTKLETLLFQWANSLTQNASVPQASVLKVDKTEGGTTIGFLEGSAVDGSLTQETVRIVLTVTPSTSDGGPAMFRAVRDGPRRREVPAGEPAIMRSLLNALKVSVNLSRPDPK